MNPQLSVWHDASLIGELSIEQGRWVFSYTDSWLKKDDHFILSPSLPLQKDRFIDTTNDKRVEWFFENLLPEGGMREAMARQANISTKDVFSLLKRYGEESAGALTLLPTDAHFPEKANYSKLEIYDLRKRLNTSKTTPLLISSDDLHMSLAGVQNKLGVLYKDNHFYLPQEAAASSHIIKPDNTNETFPFCPANEFFCMRLAKELKLSVPYVDLFHLPEPIFIIERFDRINKGNNIQRRHQVDLCQLLNKWVGYKYESHGGITIKELFKSLNHTIQPAASKNQVINWNIFNYLIGNTDAHAKNISFIIHKNGIQIAPFYDLLCVQCYFPESTLAMSINGESRPGWIEKQHWEYLADEAEVSKQLIMSYLERQSNVIESLAVELLALKEFTNEEREFIKNKIIPIIQKRVEYIREFIA